MRHWIGSTQMPLRFPELTGRVARFLLFVGRPHASLLLGVSSESDAERIYIRCEVCTSICLLPEWTISDAMLLEPTAEQKRLSDKGAGISVECSSVAVLSLPEARLFASNSPFIAEVINGL
jgi:hypothetical protein